MNQSKKTRNKHVRNKLHPNTRIRTGSGYLGMNKVYIKAERKMRKIAFDNMPATAAEILALKAIIEINMPHDPFFKPDETQYMSEADM